MHASERIRDLAGELPTGRRGVLRVATTAGIDPRLGNVIGTYTAAHPEIAPEFPEVKWETGDEGERAMRHSLAFGSIRWAATRSAEAAWERHSFKQRGAHAVAATPDASAA